MAYHLEISLDLPPASLWRTSSTPVYNQSYRHLPCSWQSERPSRAQRYGVISARFVYDLLCRYFPTSSPDSLWEIPAHVVWSRTDISPHSPLFSDISPTSVNALVSALDALKSVTDTHYAGEEGSLADVVHYILVDEFFFFHFEMQIEPVLHGIEMTSIDTQIAK